MSLATATARLLPTGNEQVPYVPHGGCWDALHLQAPEVVISGPAGTGKSRACLVKLHLCAEHNPGMRALILRQTRESLTESALVTFEQHVVPARHPILRGAQRPFRSSYQYPNGAEIVVRGLRQGGTDQAARVMSAEYDLIYVQEATEIREESWEALTTRLRNGRMTFQQLIADCNPDKPTHWLKRRCDAGRAIMLESRHQDNPRLWDGAIWTAEGLTYLATLDALTGPRRERLRYGRWVQAEGVVYEGWDAAVHLIDRFDIPNDWPRVWSVDFGFTNPFVWQAWAIDPDGRLYRYLEIYHTRRLVEDHARQIRHLTQGEPAPACIICDHDAGDRATLERYLDLPTTPALKEVSAGIQAVASRLKVARDGKARLFLLRDSLVERDQDLDATKRPCCTEEEFDGYVWDTGTGGTSKGDKPMKRDDHGMDALRYLVWSLDGAREEADGDADEYTVLRF